MQEKQFNWIVALLLNYVTCGIYSIYLFAYTGTRNNVFAEKYGEKKIMSPVLAYLLSIVTCGIFWIYWLYTYADLQVRMASKTGVQVAPSKSPIVLMLLYFVPFYSFYVICDNYNRTIVTL